VESAQADRYRLIDRLALGDYTSKLKDEIQE
jgi:hypothetical protein